MISSLLVYDHIPKYLLSFQNWKHVHIRELLIDHLILVLADLHLPV